MPGNWLLYSLVHSGWFGHSGTYLSNWREAKTYGYSEALAVCKKHMQHDGEPGLIPVSEDAMQELCE